MSITNPYAIVIYSSALTALFSIAFSAMFVKERHPWLNLLKGCGLAFCFMFILAFVWMVAI